MSAAVPALLAAAAVGLLLRGPSVPAGAGSPRLWSRRRVVVVPVVLSAVVAWALVDRAEQMVLVVLAALATAAVARMVERRRSDLEAAAVRARVVELCDGLQAELAAGQTAPVAVRRAAGDWPALEPVARVAETGGDVAAELRALSAGPGAGDLRVVAAAWQVAHRTGHGLGDTVARVAQELRAGEQTRRVVAGELASARATARLVACLPVAALLMGSGAGSDPWSFLLGSPAGLTCLAGGLVCGLAGLAWIEAIARDVDRGR